MFSTGSFPGGQKYLENDPTCRMEYMHLFVPRPWLSITNLIKLILNNVTYKCAKFNKSKIKLVQVKEQQKEWWSW